MPGKARAAETGSTLEREIVRIAKNLDLCVETQVNVGRRIWGARRKIDVVVKHGDTRKTLGIECKYQETRGTAEEKLLAILQDIKAWPIRGIVVFSGPGFSDNMKYHLISSGMAVEIEDLEPWLKLYFGI